MKKSNYISIFISILALSVSIGCLCQTLPRELGIDYLGWIVGVLALVTTILIGWNIYSIIDVRESQRKYADIINDVDFTQHKILAIQEQTNWMIYHQLLLGNDPCGLEYRFLYHATACLYHYSCMERLDICNVIVLAMKECIANAENIKMKRSKKEEIIQLLEKVKGKSKIEGYNEVLKDILLIQGVEDLI